VKMLRRMKPLRWAYVRPFSSQQLEPLTLPAHEGVAYPAIENPSRKSRQVREARRWHMDIQEAPTVGEKAIKMNLPRYYGYKAVAFGDSCIPYNSLPITQHYTRTVLEKLMPEPPGPATAPAEESGQSTLGDARAEAIEVLEFCHDYFRHLLQRPQFSAKDADARERMFTQLVVEQLNRTLVQLLGGQYPHLNETEVDFNPRHEAFWAVGGVEAAKNVVNSKKGRKWQKDEAAGLTDRFVQYSGAPLLSLRHRRQLAPWKAQDDSSNAELREGLPSFKYDARSLGYSTKHQHACNVPGYWPSANGNNFGIISFLSRSHLQSRRKSYGQSDLQETLDSLAIQASYALLLGQASNNGFSTYNELSYPMNTQTVITNGREWSFYEYQLNTLLLHGDAGENRRLNFCRGTPPIALYAEMSLEGKCVGFNDEVLRQLLNFYTKVPNVVRDAQEERPYLSSSAPSHENPEQAQFIDKTYKHLTSNRPRHLEIPEIYLWEKLYKIDNKTRAIEAKRRFFEMDINPWQRKLNQHDREYVPKAVRPGGRKNKEERYKRTFYS
ncbi:hypothetical protein KR018_011864, partial [Drosophila ironensis]